ncbi:MAG: ABC transporter substrate-binding protein [Chitinophagales bacterium]|nr:ABC transporter substrate-binding protein [Chitinophagales bacterium]
MLKRICFIGYFIAVLIAFNACTSGGDNAVTRDTVVIHSMSEPERLNPITSSDAQATQMEMNIFQSMLKYDFTTLKLIPVLAADMPEIEENDHGMSLSFTLRPEARWDNGNPVTAEDVLFSFKAIMCPRVQSDQLRNSFDFVSDAKIDGENPLKITFYTSVPNMLAKDILGSDIVIIPEYIFDENQSLRKYDVKRFLKPDEELMEDQTIKDFASRFNSEEYNRSPEKINGSGAYILKKWETQQRVILERKTNWWGDQLKDVNMFFEANPSKLIYEVINDPNTAITALKSRKLDVMTVTSIKDYLDLDKSERFKENFVKSEPPMLAFSYIGLNVRDKMLNDKRVRQALAHLVNVDQINEKILYGKGKRIIGTISPTNKEAYASELTPYDYNLEKAKQLLADAGWKDTDGDGILDKVIDGQKTPFKLTYSYNQGNPVRETVGLMIQSTFKEAGITLDVRSIDWSKYLEDLKQQKIQMFYGAWVTNPRDEDPMQLWHTESRNGGSNYTGFGDSKSDEMIMKIRAELDVNKRNQLYHQWQALLYDEVPYIFLFNTPYQNVISNRFENFHASSIYPGYYEAGFILKDKKESE